MNNNTIRQILGAILIGVLFLTLYSCKGFSCRKHEVEKAVIRHEVKKELEKQKDRIFVPARKYVVPRIPYDPKLGR